MGQIKSLPLTIKNQISHEYQPILNHKKVSNNVMTREIITLETKIINNFNKRYHLWVQFLEDTYVKVYFINSVNQKELIIKKDLKSYETISVYDPFNLRIKDHPVKVGEIIHYGKATKPNKSYFIETYKGVKYNYVVESDSKND